VLLGTLVTFDSYWDEKPFKPLKPYKSLKSLEPKRFCPQISKISRINEQRAKFTRLRRVYPPSLWRGQNNSKEQRAKKLGSDKAESSKDKS